MYGHLRRDLRAPASGCTGTYVGIYGHLRLDLRAALFLNGVWLAGWLSGWLVGWLLGKLADGILGIIEHEKNEMKNE